MNHHTISIRPFIGAKDFEISRRFYIDLGFEEKILFPNMSVFKKDSLAFYLQNAYVQEWVDNTMVFIEVADVNGFYKYLESLDLPSKYENVKLTPVRRNGWGSECFLHDPSGILWHFGQFN